MTRKRLIGSIAEAIAEKEGFRVTQDQAADRRIPWPTIAQRNANPGNIRAWRRNRRPYPTRGGFVDFVAWAATAFPAFGKAQQREAALKEGWRVLKVLISQYIDGRFTGGKPPSAKEMFAIYAPADDRNDPVAYAEFVAFRLAIRPEQPLIDLISA